MLVPFIVISVTPVCEETLAHIPVYLYTHSQSKKCAYYSSKVQFSKVSSKLSRQRSNKIKKTLSCTLAWFSTNNNNWVYSIIDMYACMYLFILDQNVVIIAIINNTVTQYE